MESGRGRARLTLPRFGLHILLSTCSIFHLCAQSLIASRIGEDSSTPALSSWFDRARAHLAPCSLAACGPTRHSLPQTTLSLGDSNQRR